MSSQNQKLLLLVVAVIVLLAGGMYLENRWSQKAAIQRVLAADSTTTQGTSSAAEIVRRMQAINLEGCPTDFQIAYRRHIRAWEAIAGVEQQVKRYGDEYGSWSAFFESAVRGALGDPLGKWRESKDAASIIRKNAREAWKVVGDTYHQVEDIAVSHGVNPQAK